jgi:hypothetical protein
MRGIGETNRRAGPGFSEGRIASSICRRDQPERLVKELPLRQHTPDGLHEGPFVGRPRRSGGDTETLQGRVSLKEDLRFGERSFGCGHQAGSVVLGCPPRPFPIPSAQATRGNVWVGDCLQALPDRARVGLHCDLNPLQLRRDLERELERLWALAAPDPHRPQGDAQVAPPFLKAPPGGS